MTSPIIFVGPSLTPQDKARFPDIRFRAPAKQGDVLRAMADKPTAIGIIDGYFGDHLAVHQKEILEAMADGILVWGGASMGALRAAELHRFGMRGVGTIFEAYVSGEIGEDADVAVTHGPDELDFVATSISMVDVQATIAALRRRRTMTETKLAKVLTAARARHFSARTWRAIASEVHKTRQGRLRLESILSSPEIQQKRLDAIDLVRCMAEEADRLEPSCKPPPLTTYYQRIRERALSKSP
ncbi:TfuA-like protein [Litoreibacter arenae]|uniref:TfuA-like core domain-containing protein n=1 Tax=Litoreibacter arenae DSM 19593 TaxID=1123360 RepID=S9RJI8_9RHOB|nr:TfuA-like protein [Litoreibacter arenae]EPX78280.1 hypothetical protein thalar_02509 [Litoreibacter arenae DSM 19593]